MRGRSAQALTTQDTPIRPLLSEQSQTSELQVAQSLHQRFGASGSHPGLALDKEYGPVERAVEPGPVIDCQPRKNRPIMGSQPRLALCLTFVAQQRVWNVFQVRELRGGTDHPVGNIRRETRTQLLHGPLQSPGAADHHIHIGHLAQHLL